jgi:hypothetical protein
MENEFVTFKTFPDYVTCREFTGLLDENSIPYEIDDDDIGVPDSLIGSDPSNKIRLKIRQQDFSLVKLLVERHDGEAIRSVGRDHYLFSFSNEELKEILERPDEWNSFDVALAKRILSERGFAINETDLKQKEEARIAALARSEAASLALLASGFFFSFFGVIIAWAIFTSMYGWFALAFGVIFATLGPLIGYSIAWFKKTLPDGRRVYKYRVSDRKKGVMIFFTGLIFLTLLVFYIIRWTFGSGLS